MNAETQGLKTRHWQYGLAVSLIVLVCAGCGFLLVFGYLSVVQMVLGAVAVAGSVWLMAFPEIALAALLMVGTLKGIPQLGNSPIDLTVALAVVVFIGALANSGKDLLSLRIIYPRAYVVYVPFLAIMLLSLTYTPNLPGGLDKAGRFLVFSGIAILAPFLVLRTPANLKRFFLTLAVLGFVVAMDSFAGLGGKERLVSEGGDTIQLGHDSALAIIVVWYLLLPRRPLLSRLCLYGIVLALCVAVIGAGSRGPAAGLACCIALSFVLHKQLGIETKTLLTDLGFLVLAALMIVPIVGIPQSSYDYLARLGDPNMHRMLGPREALMAEGWRLTMDHPLRGVGLGGFPVVFRDIGAWPHNMFLEISAEMGVFAVLLFGLLLWLSFREGLRQVGDCDFFNSQLSAMVFAFFTFEFLDIMNTGSINDNRAMWLAIALPFVLRTLRSRESPAMHYKSAGAFDPQARWDTSFTEGWAG